MSYQEILKRFKSANYKYKTSLAQKAGFTTPEEYARFLSEQTGEKVVLRTPKKTESEAPALSKSMESVDEFGVTVIGDPNPEVKQDLDLIIAFDSTGSMSTYISAVKQHATSLVKSMLKENPYVRIGIVIFGDYCDMFSNNTFGKAYQVLSPSRDKDSIVAFIRGARSTGGGDTDEFYELVLQKIHKETLWRDSANKAVLLIGDCNPHEKGHRYRPGYPISPCWREVCKDMAQEGIIVDTLSIRGYKFYEQVAEMTGGVCIPFQNSSKTAELLEATSLARGGVVTEASFMAKSMAVEASSDTEMKAVYGMYKTIK